MSNPASVRRPVVIAHRGGAPREIENSAAAFRHAIAAGADALECDVRATADGVLVLIHDSEIRLESNVRLIVRQTPYSVLKDALPWLLTLEDFLSEFGGQALINLDLKGKGYEEQLAQTVRAWGHPERVFITGQRSASLRRLADMLPEATFGLSRGHMLTRWPGRLQARGTAAARWPLALQMAIGLPYARADAVALHHWMVTQRLVSWLRRAGYAVTTWTVDETREARRVVEAGVWALTTNEPDDLIPALGWSRRPAFAGCPGWREVFDRDARAGSTSSSCERCPR
ncbi:glycerophosphodiester phosphodiesterase [Thermomicrobiaceae bacterium CFH 74404]|uniref:Glycerophosphodiester phosphodiesterase n=1 Tax=Thermalbibacter longus TaxID=2951981 RepID=A0AA41W9P1_9BACT|nr:glycerophosphodiester phosphodiesterase [Thermalbibacter longus]MCM8747746.1 glycerophosphodiester phosphodiesterase [Thermalbibacter longus]